ncbi:ImmA/IrrE family metallo-endopeptidase [Pontibacter toksunensis]|uniref:ImmA/IrrE family metallo-endopeptidase n=1 Tax=Pontibacter toksunensis TaxID=1332631 RepID=A0ABW6BZM8_9BACT
MLREKREAEIAALAETIADSFSPSQVVDLGAIAAANSITFDYGAYETFFDGMLQYHKGKFHIFLNLDKLGNPNSPRARFTIAHELGHFYIDEHRNALTSGKVKPHTSMVEIYNNENLAEIEADCFASNLLMPESRFMDTCKGSKKTGMAAILFLSDTFQVSVLSAAVNYIKRNICPCSLIKWGDAGYQWSLQSRSFMDLFSRKVHLTYSPGRDTATYKALHQKDAYSLDFHKSVTTMSTWCKSIHPTGKDNLILNEESKKLGAYGGITLLTLSNL